MREKWNRDDYRERTIKTALAWQTETHSAASWQRPASVALAADAVAVSIETLNATTLFHGRLRLASLSQRGSMVLALTKGWSSSLAWTFRWNSGTNFYLQVSVDWTNKPVAGFVTP